MVRTVRGPLMRNNLLGFTEEIDLAWLKRKASALNT